MQIAKQDMEAAALIYCQLMQQDPNQPDLPEDPNLPLLQKTMLDFRKMLCLNEAMRIHLSNKMEELDAKLHETAAKESNRN